MKTFPQKQPVLNRHVVHSMKRLIGNRNLVLLLSVTLGLVMSRGVRWTEPLTLPALAVVMTLSTMGVSSAVFRTPRELISPALVGIGMNYAILGGLLLGMSALIIREEAIWSGFVLLAAVPPAVAVVPFTDFLKGDRSVSLIGSIGGYLGALIIMPLITIGLLGTSFMSPIKLVLVMVELIVLPLILSRVLLWTQLASRIEPVRGLVTNWSFFVVVYTIVGLNREVFVGRPLSMIPVAIIAIASTFFLGMGIEWVTRLAGVDPKKVTSLVLLGTLKNYGLAGGLALAFFSEQTAVPCTVSTIFMIVYIIWLGFRIRNSGSGT